LVFFAGRKESAWLGGRSALGLAVAAVTRRNGISMRAGLGVPEERADTLVQLRADDVFELARLRVRLGFVDGKSVLEEALGQAVTADHVARALAAHGRELYLPVLHLHQAQIRHARKNSRSRFLRNNRHLPSGAGRVQALGLRRLPFFAANPNLLEKMVETNFVVGGNSCAAVTRVGKRAIQRMAWTVLRRIEVQVAVSEFDAAVRLARDVRVVRHLQDRMAGVVQFAENLDDDGFIGLVEVARGLVSKNDFWLVDQRARDGHALLFAAGKLRGEVRQAVAKAYTLQRFFGLLFVRHAMAILREHYVFQRREVRHEMKLLEDEADPFRAVTN